MNSTVQRRDGVASNAEPARDNDEPISQRLTFLLHRLVAALVDATAQQYRAYGLSIPAARAMVSLLESGGTATVGNLAETTCIDLSTISHILRRLEQQGHVRRERQTSDNRVVLAVLTRTGRNLAKICREASFRHEAILIRDMPPQNVADLKRALETAYINMRHNPASQPE